jgi:hypothetical protein
MHGLTGGSWKRDITGHGHRSGTISRETAGTQGYGTYRQWLSSRQLPTLLSLETINRPKDLISWVARGPSWVV